ncbi:MAG: hypothetical protein ACRDD1_11010 [Planctomycetia bacterium]
MASNYAQSNLRSRHSLASAGDVRQLRIAEALRLPKMTSCECQQSRVSLPWDGRSGCLLCGDLGYRLGEAGSPPFQSPTLAKAILEQPASWPPGTGQKLSILALRYAHGLELWVKGDVTAIGTFGELTQHILPTEFWAKGNHNDGTQQGGDDAFDCEDDGDDDGFADDAP